MKIYDNGIVRDMTVEETELHTKQKKEVEHSQSYEDFVETLIRQKYSVSAELAILRQRDTKPNEFEEYNAYAEKCKIDARKRLLTIEEQDNIEVVE